VAAHLDAGPTGLSGKCQAVTAGDLVRARPRLSPRFSHKIGANAVNHLPRRRVGPHCNDRLLTRRAPHLTNNSINPRQHFTSRVLNNSHRFWPIESACRLFEPSFLIFSSTIHDYAPPSWPLHQGSFLY